MMASSSGNPNLEASFVFSEENRENTIERIRDKLTGFKFMQSAMLKRAAVLIPLCIDTSGCPSLLYTLRSLKLASHRGEICFPGGAADPEDNGDDVATALRETEEELGIPKTDIEIWSILNPMPTASSLMGVTPVLGLINGGPLDPTKLKVNPDEVEVAFTISFQHLCDPENWGHTQFKRGFGMPVYKNMKVFHPPHLYSRPAGLSSSEEEEEEEVNKPRDVRLWGLTAILTHVVLEAIIPHAYKRHVPMLKTASTSDKTSKL
jgi:nudix motif 8